MAVFTALAPEELKPWIGFFSIGDLLQMDGIAEGTENSNFKLVTTQGVYVLTIFESLTEEKLPFYLELTNHLYLKGVPCAHPIADREGNLYRILKGKPAVIVPFIKGSFLEQPLPKHCFAVGDWLSRMHLAGRDFPLYKEDERGLSWQKEVVETIKPFLSKKDAKDIIEELSFQESLDWQALPQGPIHADLFRDNVLFMDDCIIGVIDFYFAFTGAWIYDIAVAINDWCIKPDGGLDDEKTAAFLEGYMQKRALLPEEKKFLAPMLRRAALRFWISRLYAFYLPRQSRLSTPKDPDRFKMILEKSKSMARC
jgi:homoserine kinase type II